MPSKVAICTDVSAGGVPTSRGTILRALRFVPDGRKKGPTPELLPPAHQRAYNRKKIHQTDRSRLASTCIPLPLPAWATSNSSDLPQPVRPSTQAWPVLYWHDFLPSTTYTCFLFCPLQCNAQKRELITRGSQPAPMPPKPGHITTFSPTTQMPVPLLFSTVPCLPHQFNALPTPEYKIYSPYVSVPTMCLRGPFASSSISSSSSERHSVQ